MTIRLHSNHVPFDTGFVADDVDEFGKGWIAVGRDVSQEVAVQVFERDEEVECGDVGVCCLERNGNGM